MELRLKVGARGRGGEKRTREEEEKAGKTKEEEGRGGKRREERAIKCLASFSNAVGMLLKCIALGMFLMSLSNMSSTVGYFHISH